MTGEKQRSELLHRSYILLVLLAVLIITIDWYTPAGIAVGLLVVMPIIMTAVYDTPQPTQLIVLLAAAMKLAESLFGPDPRAAPTIWITNRILVVASWLAGWWMAVVLRRLRQEVEQQRNRAFATSHLNRLLISLVAHDYRSPLALVAQALDYATGTLAAGGKPDADLLHDVRRRIQRSIDDSERLVHMVEGEFERDVSGPVLHPLPLRSHMQREIDAFQDEASVAGKTLIADVEIEAGTYALDTLVLRHLLGVLLENAIRHALPGTIRVRAVVENSELRCEISDPGPALGHELTTGMGYGFQLAIELARRAGGDITSNIAADGSMHVLRLPVQTLDDAL